MFYPPPSVADFSGLFRLIFSSHCRRSSLCLVILHRRSTSTFLRPLAPWALPHFVAVMDALTPAGRLFGPLAMNTVLSRRVSLFTSPTLPTPLSSTTPCNPAPAFRLRSCFFLLGTASQSTRLPFRAVWGTFPCRSWLRLRQRSQVGRLMWPNQVHFASF